MIHFWLDAVTNRLRSVLTDSLIEDRNKNILIMPDGKPAATGGVIFIAVHPGGSFNPRLDTYGQTLEESYEVICTVSQRTRNVPEDRVGESMFIQTTKSLSRIVLGVRNAVSSVGIMQATIKAAMTAENVSGDVVEVLRWSRTNPPVPRDKSWFMSADPYDTDSQPSGFSCEIVFTGGTTITGIGC